jgi:hypothetical protein
VAGSEEESESEEELGLEYLVNEEGEERTEQQAISEAAKVPQYYIFFNEYTFSFVFVFFVAASGDADRFRRWRPRRSRPVSLWRRPK